MLATEIAPGSASTRSIWLVLAAAVALLGLLLAFQLVVREAVQQGELRRDANALLLEATWRCNTLRDRVLRQTCLQRIDAVPRENARLRAPAR